MIYVIICKLTKYAIILPFKSTYGEKQTAQIFVDNVVCHFGLPSQIISDRDTRWRNDFWREVCLIMGARRSLTTAYHPQADGQSEILNQTIEVALRAYINKDKNNWVDLLPSMAFAYNNTPHTATKYTPSWLLMGYQPRLPIYTSLDEKYIQRVEGLRLAANDSLRRAQVIFERNYNKNHQKVEF